MNKKKTIFKKYILGESDKEWKENNEICHPAHESNEFPHCLIKWHSHVGTTVTKSNESNENETG